VPDDVLPGLQHFYDLHAVVKLFCGFTYRKKKRKKKYYCSMMTCCVFLNFDIPFFFKNKIFDIRLYND
jgi:hypothetical protein